MTKTYIDWMQCKAKTTQYWELFNISMNAEKIKQYTNEQGYINVTMSKRKEVWQYWETHYFVLNDWKPKTEEKTNDSQEEISVEDIPF